MRRIHYEIGKLYKSRGATAVPMKLLGFEHCHVAGKTQADGAADCNCKHCPGYLVFKEEEDNPTCGGWGRGPEYGNYYLPYEPVNALDDFPLKKEV